MDHDILDLLEEFADLFFNCDAEPVDDELVRELLADLAAVVVEGTGCWEEAAVATGGLAGIAKRAGNVDGRAEELWGETADLFTKVGDAESARKYAANACRLALDALRSITDDADTTAAFARARAARELAVRHRRFLESNPVSVLDMLRNLYSGSIAALRRLTRCSRRLTSREPRPHAVRPRVRENSP